MISVRVLLDSINSLGARLTTLLLTFPRSILSEHNTHRVTSKNFSSSRALAIATLLQQCIDNPYMPLLRANKKGMQAGEVLSLENTKLAEDIILSLRDASCDAVRRLAELNVHKQYANRYLEPWQWCTGIVSSTDWANLIHLRNEKSAEPNFDILASMIKSSLETSVPKELDDNDWAFPLVDGDYSTEEIRLETYDKIHKLSQNLDEVFEFLGHYDAKYQAATTDVFKFILEEVFESNAEKAVTALTSAGRCARVSYLNHESQKIDILDTIRLGCFLAEQGHFSPLEHIARPATAGEVTWKLNVDGTFERTGYVGNFYEWTQIRKLFHNENFPSR